MTSFKQRFISLINLLILKQKAFKVKQKLLKAITSNKNQLRSAKKVTFQFQSIYQLFKALIKINVPQLSTMLMLSIVSLIIQLFCANINSFIIELFQKQQSILNLIKCILILIIYKITKSIIDQCSSYLQMNYGFLGYSALYYNFLNNKKQMTGQILNIIQDDIEKIANMPYSLINFPYLSILILVLTTMLAVTLQQNVFILVVVSLLLYSVNTAGGIIIFYLNGKVMRQKDYRLSLNLKENKNPQIIQQARKKEVLMIRSFLMVKVVVKWFTQVCFIVFYGVVFLWKNQTSQTDDDLYYRLMLLGMLKVAFSSLYIESYFLALVFNSLKRIIICQNREQIQKSTIGCFEDFIKKSNINKIKQGQSQRQSSDSSLCSEISANQSFLKSDLQISKEQMKSIDIIQKKSKLSKQKRKYQKYREHGNIKILQLLKYIRSNIHLVLTLLLLFLGFATLYTKFQYLHITKSIIHNKMNMFEIIIFIMPGIVYLLFYLVIIILFGQVSQNLFKNLSSQQISGEDLNRISGDIQLVDKYIPPTFYQFFITVFGLLSSLLLTITLIKDIYFAISTSLIILTIIMISIYLNRYFMKSRRQIKRLQCRMKSKIIQVYTQHISQYSQQQIQFSIIQGKWKKINILKNIGIIIQNSYILLLNILVLLIQIICFVICYASSIDSTTSKLILVFILQLDLSLTGLLLNTISLELGLVNFQRCLNFVKNKNILNSSLNSQQQQTN